MDAMISKKTKRVTFTILYAIYFVVYLDWSFIPILFSPLIIKTSSTLLPITTSIDTRNVIFGLLISTAPALQLISAPVLGSLSDQFGRKPTLLFTTFVATIAFCLTALAIHFSSIVLLFISRIIAGLSAGNVSVCQATVADLTKQKVRGQYLSIFIVLTGTAWMVGPLLANALSNPNIGSWFNLATPFWLLSMVFLLCFISLLIAFTEPNMKLKKHDHLTLAQSLMGFVIIWQRNIIRIPLIVFLLAMFGWFLVIMFFPPYLHERFGIGKEFISSLISYLSLWFLLGALLTKYLLRKKYKPEQLIILPLLLFGTATLLIAFYNNINYLWFSLIFCGACQAIAVVCLMTLCSNNASSDIQGKIFGVINAILGLCFAVTPILSGIFSAIWINLPTLLGSIIILSAACYYFYFRNI